MVEYAVLAGLIAAAATLAVTNLGGENRDVFERVTSATGTGLPGGPSGGGTTPPVTPPATPVPGDNFDIVIGAAVLPPAAAGQAWSYDFSSLVALTDPGGVTVPALSWSGGNPPLPSFLVIDQNGVVTGTPPGAGDFDFEVVASFDSTTGSRVFTLSIGSMQIDVTQIASGGFHTCALATGGSVWCWGNNQWGQIGDGTNDDRLSPVQISGLPPVSAISLGENHTCALATSLLVYCWGQGYMGQLGDGQMSDQTTPVQVVGISGVHKISAGFIHTCAVTIDDTAYCWGAADRLGSGGFPVGDVPVEVAGSAGITRDVASGEWASCLVTTSDQLRCWGQNFMGFVGDGTTDTRETPVSVTIPGGLAVSNVAMGAMHGCAIAGGSVYCWGGGFMGQLGLADTLDRLTPTLATNTGITGTPFALSLGFGHSCALETGGGLRCWGDNFFGQLGDGTVLSGANQVSVGYYHTCIRSGAQAICFGQNESGQLGDGTDIDRSTPQPVQF